MSYRLYSNEDIRNALRAIEAARAGVDAIRCMAMRRRRRCRSWTSLHCRSEPNRNCQNGTECGFCGSRGNTRRETNDHESDLYHRVRQLQ